MGVPFFNFSESVALDETMHIINCLWNNSESCIYQPVQFDNPRSHEVYRNPLSCLSHSHSTGEGKND